MLDNEYLQNPETNIFIFFIFRNILIWHQFELGLDPPPRQKKNEEKVFNVDGGIKY